MTKINDFNPDTSAFCINIRLYFVFFGYCILLPEAIFAGNLPVIDRKAAAGSQSVKEPPGRNSVGEGHDPPAENQSFSDFPKENKICGRP